MNIKVSCDRQDIMYQVTLKKCDTCGMYHGIQTEHSCNKPDINYITVEELRDTLSDLSKKFGDFPITSVSLDNKGRIVFFTIIDDIPTVLFRVTCQEVPSIHER